MRLLNELSIGQRILQERKRLNWSQEQLAATIGATAKSINRWEHDRVVPNPFYRKRLCEVFNLSAEALFGQGEGLIWTVPHLRNRYFTGRDELLTLLHETLISQKTVALTALSGLGGIGKTQVALEYAYRFAADYEAVLWIHADSQQALVTDFLLLADLLQLSENQESDQQRIVKIVVRWLQQTSRRWLLILDNVEDLELVSKFLPTRGSGHVLLTTRHPSAGASIQAIEVGTLNQEQGALLLLRKARWLEADATLEQADEHTRRDAETIAEALGTLPLALDQAGAYIEETQCSLANYLRLYQTRRVDLLRRPDSMSTQETPQVVATTWNLSFEQVEQANPAAADLLRLCAFLHPDGIPETLLLEGAAALGPVLQPVVTDPLLLDEAIRSLRRVSLVRRIAEKKQLTLHRLVQIVLKDAMDRPTYSMWAERVVRMVSLAMPEIIMEVASWSSQWPTSQLYLPHALVCADLIAQEDMLIPEAAELLFRAATYLCNRGQFGAAEPLYQQSLAIRERVLGPDHPDTARNLHNLALIYYDQGKYAQAEPLHLRALAISEQALDPQHPYIAKCLNSLAILYHDWGKYTQAELLYERAITILQQVLGPQHPSTAGTLNNLAEIYCLQGKYAESELLFKQVQEIYRTQLGPDHPHLAESQSNLAELYRVQGKFEQAEQLNEQAAASLEKHFGPEHPRSLRTLTNLAMLYRDEGKYEQAELLFQRILTTWEQQQGAAQHPDKALCLHGLATLYFKQGKHEQAVLLLQRALSIREQSLGSEHPDTARSLNALALIYREQGTYAQAETLFLRTLAIREQICGADHPDTARTLNDLALLYLKAGKYQQAETLFLRALAILERRPGSQPHLIADILENYATLVHQTQQ